MRTQTLLITLTLSIPLACSKSEPTPSEPAALSSAQSAPETPQTPFKMLTVEKVVQRLANKNEKTFLFNANPKEVFASEHLPNAVFVPKEQGITANLLPQDKNTSLIFYYANER